VKRAAGRCAQLLFAAGLAACGGGADNSSGSATSTATTTPTSPTTATARSFKAEVWADNWFSLYVGESYVGEDSVPITTERSFNAETLSFSASYPFVLNFIVKDYKQNDTGLEYIGTAKQQIGDGGFITQITDTTTGKVVAASSSAVKCTVIHTAPLNTACAAEASPTLASCGATITAEPTTWKAAGFDASGWQSASVYSAAEVGVKDGYNTVAWDASAKLIWSADLKADNTLLCKLSVTSP
jgi:hypothetical protein